MAATAATAPIATDLSCVSYAPLRLRPTYKPTYKPEDETEPNDIFVVIRLGDLFRYVIPPFDILFVSLRQMRIKGDCDEVRKVYDIFIRDSAVLRSITLPATVVAKDYVLIPVSFHINTYTTIK